MQETLHPSFYTCCENNLQKICTTFENNPNYEADNAMYQILKNLLNGLQESKSIANFLSTHQVISSIVHSMQSDAYAEYDDEKVFGHEYLSYLDMLTENQLNGRYESNDAITVPHNFDSLPDETDLCTYFMVDNNIITVDSLFAIKCVRKYCKLPQNENLNMALFKTDLSGEVFHWFTVTNNQITMQDLEDIQANFLVKYIALSFFYDEISLIN